MKLQHPYSFSGIVLTILLLSGAAAAAGPEDNFPPNGQIPVGWATPPGANAGWGVASDSTNGGTFSLKSGALLDDPTSPSDTHRTAAIQVGGNFSAGNIMFAYRVSSELNADFFQFYIDGQRMLNISGSIPWSNASFPVSAGSHVLKWVYDKDASLSDPVDAAWIDTVVLPVATVQQILSVTRSGNGSGTVFSNPAGVSCGGVCLALFATGTPVTLTAAAGPGKVFSGWSGGCAGTSQICAITMSAGVNVVANFAQADDIFPPGGQLPAGWTNSADSNVSWKVATDSTYRGGFSLKSGSIADSQASSIQFTSTVIDGTVEFAYRVSSEAFYDILTFYIDDVARLFSSGEVDWTKASIPVSAGTHVFKFAYRKDASGLSGSDAAWIDAVVIPTNTSVRRLNVIGAGTGAGTITSSTGGIICGATCTATFATNSVTTLSATAAAGSVFKGWGGGCSGVAATCQVTMDAAKDVTVTFWVPGTSGPLDVDASGPNTEYDALTDGLLIVRYMFGLTGQALTANTLGATATRTDPAAITAYLDGIRTTLDIDGNGSLDALTDGLLIVRYLFGLRGSQLISNTVGPNATRSTAAQVETYIQSLMP